MARNLTQDAVVNMAISDEQPAKKDSKQLFGPDIGVVNSAPAWTHSTEKNAAADAISSEIIKSWIAKSKEPSQPTTTLQALVNLKRPTLRLVPLAIAPEDDPEHADSHHHHGLEFEYDADAPKCRIDVNVMLPADHPLAEKVDSRGFSSILVFQTVVEGGFGKFLKLEEGATLELGRFEQAPQPEEVTSEKAPDAPATSSDVASPRNGRRRKRFTAFNFRKRGADRAASGPALAVVDAEAPNTSAETEKEKQPKDDMREGVRVAIRLSALDEDGMDVPIVNEQTTYLHVVRLGAPPAEQEEDHDARPWVVKVIKREATIGPHTFHLHEIYGLAAQTSAPAHPQAPSTTNTDVHTYPPTAPAPLAPVEEEEPASECLVCLSSPREVILLPCRHLVACKDCAVNMIEFGAGGNIVHNEEPNAANGGTDGAAGEGAGSGAANTSNAAETPIPTVLPPNPRRKRKAKGWFCPVCRQPYTSLLRISTTPHTKDISDDENLGSGSLDDPERENEGAEANDSAGAAAPTSTSGDPLTTSSGMMNTLRSGFRNLALGGTRTESDTLPRDVERGAEVAI